MIATNTTNEAKRTGAVEDDVLTTAHRLATALHRNGAMDAPAMRDMEQLCRPPRSAPAGRTLASGQTD